MVNLSIVLFLLGVVFLLLGWRWQSPSNEEAMTALKGLACLKRELLRVQAQVHILEDEILTARQVELKESVLREIESNELRLNELGSKETKLYSVKTKEVRERTNGEGGEPKLSIPTKFQEVLELSVKGNSIPQIAQQLSLSQDAVMMVLQMHTKGVAR